MSEEQVIDDIVTILEANKIDPNAAGRITGQAVLRYINNKVFVAASNAFNE